MPRSFSLQSNPCFSMTSTTLGLVPCSKTYSLISGMRCSFNRRPFIKKYTCPLIVTEDLPSLLHCETFGKASCVTRQYTCTHARGQARNFATVTTTDEVSLLAAGSYIVKTNSMKEWIFCDTCIINLNCCLLQYTSWSYYKINFYGISALG
jgi:hypothetical protein